MMLNCEIHYQSHGAEVGAFYWGGGDIYEMYFYFAQFLYHSLISLTSSEKLHGNLSL